MKRLAKVASFMIIRDLYVFLAWLSKIVYAQMLLVLRQKCNILYSRKKLYETKKKERIKSIRPDN